MWIPWYMIVKDKYKIWVILETPTCVPKSMHDITCGNGNNTYGNDGNAHSKSCQLKLNYINCHVNSHVRFGVQVGTQISA